MGRGKFTDEFKRDVVVPALLMAVRRPKPNGKVLVHSDQGSQFTCMERAAFLGAHTLEHSMRRRGNCHDNAVAESLFNPLKRERIRRRTIGPEKKQGRTCSITSKCSTTRSASMRGTGCCHPPSSDGSR